MSKRVIIWLLFAFLVFPVNIFSQTKIDKKRFVGKSFWTKFVLATDSDCKIRIAPRDISPGAEICSFIAHIKANTEIKLKQLADEKDWAKLTFEVNTEEFDLFLKNGSKKDFHESFDLALSSKKISEEDVSPSCSVQSKLDIIKKMGIPSRISRTGESEKWTFGVGWIGGYPCGFDETYIEIKKDKVVGMSGII
jgi:hypothetical protein